MGFFFYSMKHKEYVDTIYKKLVREGIHIDREHHTHSIYKYDKDGIAINKGDWLVNEYHKEIRRKGKRYHTTAVSVVDYSYLMKLLYKQAYFEIACGYADNKKTLYYYLLSYYCRNILYFEDDPKLDFNYNKPLMEVIKAVMKKGKNEMDLEPMKDSRKVHIHPSITNQKMAGRLAKEGERRYNDYWIGKFIEENPGRSRYWYSKNCPVGKGKTVYRYFDRYILKKLKQTEAVQEPIDTPFDYLWSLIDVSLKTESNKKYLHEKLDERLKDMNVEDMKEVKDHIGKQAMNIIRDRDRQEELEKIRKSEGKYLIQHKLESGLF